MKVELIDSHGGDIAVARAAWTSTMADIKGKTPEQIRKLIVKTLWNNKTGKAHKCYDDKTEILTNSGWKLFSELEDNDLVCAIDPVTKGFNFEKPSENVSFDYNEPMYYLQTQQLDLAVTKGHRMFVSETKNSNYGKNFNIKTVEEIEGKTVKYLKSAINYNNKDLFESNLAKLIGFFIGDGYITKSFDIKFHIKKQRKIDFLYSLGFNIIVNKHDTYVIRDKNLAKYLKENCYYNSNKGLPMNYMDFSKNDVENLLTGLKNSDGSIKRNTWVYYTTSEILKDQLITLSALNNFVFTESFINNNGVNTYRLNYSKRTAPEVVNQPSRLTKNKVEEWIHYSGKVYCVTVSTGLVLVRRNGKICISGNTPFERALIEVNITCDQASHIHLLKHRLANINGESARYKELLEDKTYVPEDWLNQKIDKSVLVESLDVMADSRITTWAEGLETMSIITNELYHKSLEQLEPSLGRKRAKESSRFFKMMNSEITLSVMMNMSCFANFYNLRADIDAQLEIRLIAEEVFKIIKGIPEFGFIIEAFELERYNREIIKAKSEFATEVMEKIPADVLESYGVYYPVIKRN